MEFKDDITEQGYVAYWDGKSLDDNPWQYTPKIFHQAKWATGWKNAKNGHDNYDNDIKYKEVEENDKNS